jgi:predicted outer membrane repeat protein
MVQASEAAGAVSVMWGQQVQLLRVQLLNNTAKAGSGGAISAGNTWMLQMHDVLLQGNKVNAAIVLLVQPFGIVALW